jgi:hypothetical protein
VPRHTQQRVLTRPRTPNAPRGLRECAGELVERAAGEMGVMTLEQFFTPPSATKPPPAVVLKPIPAVPLLARRPIGRGLDGHEVRARRRRMELSVLLIAGEASPWRYSELGVCIPAQPRPRGDAVVCVGVSRAPNVHPSLSAPLVPPTHWPVSHTGLLS